MIYKARCHVCGTEHDVEAEFLSCSRYADGQARMSCGKHTGEEIAAAYWKGNEDVRPSR